MLATLIDRPFDDKDWIYPSIAKALSASAVIDGELVALDAKGISRFQLLQNVLNTKAPLVYCVFDLLFLDGKDLRKKPLVEETWSLTACIWNQSHRRYTEVVDEST
jgi:bifunctional non-homologous end joining protein LigD